MQPSARVSAGAFVKVCMNMETGKPPAAMADAALTSGADSSLRKPVCILNYIG